MEQKLFYLYKIINTVNDKLYIGITCRPKDRLREHFSKKSKCSKLRHAVNKYGKDCFSMEIICIGTEEYILELEPKVIDLYDSIENGYNLMSGHPNKNGLFHSAESLDKISNSLKKYYSENESYNKGRLRPESMDTSPYFISGFWFPDKRVAMNALRMGESSFYKRRADGTLGDVCHPQSKSISHSPVYISGFWFNSLIDAVVILSRPMDYLQLLIRSGDTEARLERIGSRPRTKPDSSAIGVNKRESGRYRAVLFSNKVRILSETFDTELEASIAYDNCYETIHGTRPNKTNPEDFING